MKYGLIGFFVIITYVQTLATHNRAGEIRYEQISDLRIRLELITYTKTSSVSADRDTITVFWGDGTVSSIDRHNGNGFILPNDIKMNIYEMEHTFPGRGEYTVSMLDPNRIDNILNIDPPNSVNIPFFIQTTIRLFNSTFQGLNRSPQLTNPPIDFACLNQTFIHNPGAIDLDDDSLSFELIVPLMDIGTAVPNYLFPNQILPGINNIITFNSKNGSFVWKSPQLEGEYNIAILIKEFRRGQLISSTIRDMQIFVRKDCISNVPPNITGPLDTCIIAGNTLNVNFNIDDLNRDTRGGKVKVEGFGAPFQIQPIASLTSGTSFEKTPYNINLHWKTSCTHVRNNPYTIILKATDNFDDTTGLSSIFIYNIKVIGPPPENLSSNSNNATITLNWDYPYLCDDTNNTFRGFSIWRKELQGFISDSCDPGLEKYGYTRIEYLTNQFDGVNYFYVDTTAERNHNYCYRVQAEFALKTSNGFLYNFTPSLPSNESCSNLRSNKPLILNVDVTTTEVQNGEIYIKYQKPLIPEIDTLVIIPPYKIKVLHSINQQNLIEIPAFTRLYSNYFKILDTSFNHSSINTKDVSHQYQVSLESINTSVILESEPAKSIFLTAQNINKYIKLSWNNEVPWINEKFTIYRRNISTVTFDSIGIVSNLEFIDRNIELDTHYCYYVKSNGFYSINTIERPLINKSNIVCIKAEDSTPPCCPILSVKGPCELNDSNYVELSWQFNEDSCSSKEISSLEIHTILGDAIEVIPLQSDIRVYTIYNTNSLNACYRINTLNRKGLNCTTPTECVSFCPEFVLPNTFTPNGDGKNDRFEPIKSRQIYNVKFTVFNQWGNEIFSSLGPKLSWDGKNNKGKICNDGTYFYVCEYTTQRGISTINGFIELIGGK
ncbi:MAG: gliding motility-associated C-terminal domain-containing protein [Saprospiraceae bacterium]|nr:gliding motility-associated C-terminal domain-containing protein [Saprospiraceae bacterium]